MTTATTTAPLDLSRFDAPLEPVILPGGRVAPVRAFTLGMSKLYDRMAAGESDAFEALLRRCVPSITDEEADDLTENGTLLIIAHCRRKLNEVLGYLGNEAAEREAAKAAPDSAPETPSVTPSPESPAQAA